MEVRKLRNPTAADSEFMYAGRVYIVKAGTEESFPGEIVKHYTLNVNGPLVESTGEPEPKKEPQKKAEG